MVLLLLYGQVYPWAATCKTQCSPYRSGN